jgi:hypothetical protein
MIGPLRTHRHRAAFGPEKEASMDRSTPTVSEVVRRAVELADPDETNRRLGSLQRQLEDDDEPITAVENIDERLAIALEGADVEGEDPAVSVAGAIARYLASHPGEVGSDESPEGIIRRAVEAQWHRTPPAGVEAWLAGD